MTFGILQRCLTTLSVLLFLSPLVALAEDGDAEFAYAAGHFKTQRWKYASEAFEDFLEKYPNHSRIHMAQLYYGLALNSLNDYAPAREQLLKFVKAYPSSRNIADARFHIAECSYNLREFKQAVTAFDEYLARHESHNLRGWAQLMLGESHNELTQWKQAESVLTAFLQAAPEQRLVPDAEFALGVALQGQQRSSEAITQFRKVIQLKATSLVHRAHARIGTVHYNNKQYADASAAYDTIVRDFADLPIAGTAALQSAIAQFQLKQFDEALQRLDRVPAESDAAGHAAMWRGFCYRELGQLDTARESLGAAFVAAGDTPLAAEILFNRAQIEVMAERKTNAAQMFLDLADRWPKHRRVADSLLNAAQLKVEVNDYATSQRVLSRLQSEFPDKATEPAVLVLEGRLLLNVEKTDEAIVVLQKAADQPAETERQKLFRNYHLIRALHRGEQFQETVARFETLRTDFMEADGDGLHGAISVAAMSCLELQQYEKAQQFATDFLTLEGNMAKRSDALAARAIASSHLKQYDKSAADLKVLSTEFAGNSETWMAALQCAESAWQAEDYAAAAGVFELVAGADIENTGTGAHESGLSGAAWSRYKLGEFENAASLFQQVVTDYPDSDNAVEAAYMHAVSLQDAGSKTEAGTAFLKLYEQLEQQDVADPNARKYLRDTGQMYANLVANSGDIDAADAMWERVAEQFSESDTHDDILDSWAFLNLENGRFERSDEIYRQLLDKHPESRHAGLARLSLAESEMQAGRFDTALREFMNIFSTSEYGDTEKEGALYHVIYIHAAERHWTDVKQFAEVFDQTFPDSEHTPAVQLLHAEALLDQKQFQLADSKLSVLRKAVLDETISADEWTERIWVVLAEVALAESRYDKIDGIAEELKSRAPKSRFLFQMRDVQGRRWKSQAAPDFAKAREFFASVVNDEFGRGTETAARCQFLIGESLLLEKQHKEALKEYYRVYLNYPFEDWKARGLFQAAGCEATLGDMDAARRSYEDLIREFPENDLAQKAAEQLKALTK